MEKSVKSPAKTRVRLDAGQIVHHAIRLIEDEGLDNFSTRILGKAMGVEAMAIYHYFASKDRLLDAVSGKLVSEIGYPPRTGNWRADMEMAGRQYYAVAKRYPRCFPLLAMRRFNSPETLGMLDHIFSILEAAGLPPAEIAKGFRMMGYFLSGAGLAYGATMQAARREDFILPNPDFLASYPVVSRTIPHLGADNLDAIFEAGLNAMLDGIAGLIEHGERSHAPD